MPIVCINRPNRSRKREWTPVGLTRIVKLICDKHGQEVTEEACEEGYCGDTKCVKIATEVVSTIVGVYFGLMLAQTIELLMEIPVLKQMIKATPFGKAIAGALASLRGTIPDLGLKAEQMKQLELVLNFFIKTKGRVWMGVDIPPGF
jgi:hypothetical protein